MASILTLGISYSTIYYKSTNEKNNKNNNIAVADNYKESTTDDTIVEEVSLPDMEENEPERDEVYDGLTYEELVDKLNRVLSSDLSGMGEAYVKYSLELGVDPYLAVAISMHETGCTWNCSTLLKTCNNVGGQKGEGCGEYKAYDTLEDGIYGFIYNIKVNYVDYGLTNAELMNPKYAEDMGWSAKVNAYIEQIRNS